VINVRHVDVKTADTDGLHDPPIICQESDRTTWWIREAVKIRQEGQDIMNRDERAFLLSHVYDDLLLSTATTVMTPSRESSDEKGNISKMSLIFDK